MSCCLQDVKLTAANDDQYFVFEDYIYQVSNCTCFRQYVPSKARVAHNVLLRYISIMPVRIHV